jgi:hypothetical protein
MSVCLSVSINVDAKTPEFCDNYRLIPSLVQVGHKWLDCQTGWVKYRHCYLLACDAVYPVASEMSHSD